MHSPAFTAGAGNFANKSPLFPMIKILIINTTCAIVVALVFWASAICLVTDSPAKAALARCHLWVHGKLELILALFKLILFKGCCKFFIGDISTC